VVCFYKDKAEVMPCQVKIIEINDGLYFNKLRLDIVLIIRQNQPTIGKNRPSAEYAALFNTSVRKNFRIVQTQNIKQSPNI
jgi:hypothetical protein